MNDNSIKKHGFTLIETIISICVIGIISIGVYGAFLLIIKQIKIGEEKQNVALVGKRVIEDIKGSIKSKNNNISISEDGKIELLGYNPKLIMDGNINSFKTTLYLDNKYNYLIDPESDKDKCIYEEEILIEKAKGKTINNEGKETYVNIDIDKDEKLESDSSKEEGGNSEGESKKTEIKVKPIECKLQIKKEPGEDKRSFVDGNEIPINNNSNKLTLNIYIKMEEGRRVLVIKDCNGNDLSKQDLINNNDPINLHINFKDYKKLDNEKLRDMEINFSKDIEEEVKAATKIYIEKSVDIKVDIVKGDEDISVYHRSDTGTIEKVGPLYNIKIKISKVNSKEDKTILFNGYSNQNINIESKRIEVG